MMRVKSVFGRVNKYQFNEVSVAHTPEVCYDLSWFLQRYPLEVEQRAQAFLADQSAAYQQTMAELERLAAPDYKPVTLAGLAKPAREYQTRAVEIFWKRGGLLLADQLGLGKSISAIASLTRSSMRPALVVCQSHLPKQWEFYVQTFLPTARVHIIKSTKPYKLPAAEIYLCTYHKLHGWVELLKPFIRTLIFDEVQELRHPDSGKSQAARALRAGVQFCMGLSATPIYNYGGEIFNIMEVIAPGMLGERAEFEREWCQNRGEHALLKDPDAFGNYLRQQHLMLLRTREQVGRELPPVQTIVETVDCDEKVLGSIDKLATELAHRVLKGSFEESGQAAREFDMRLRQTTGIAKAPAVAAFVQMLVESGERVLLCGWHREVYDIWQHHFDELGIKSVYYTGTESPQQKERTKFDFMQGHAQVMIMSLRSGVGLDGLQDVCSTIVYGELDWSPGVHEQCRGRLLRDGQSRNIMEFYLVSGGGSDPMIGNVLGLKGAQIRGLLTPGGKGLQQASAASRVKQMAEEYLKRKGVSLVEERPQIALIGAD